MDIVEIIIFDWLKLDRVFDYFMKVPPEPEEIRSFLLPLLVLCLLWIIATIFYKKIYLLKASKRKIANLNDIINFFKVVNGMSWEPFWFLVKVFVLTIPIAAIIGTFFFFRGYFSDNGFSLFVTTFVIGVILTFFTFILSFLFYLFHWICTFGVKRKNN